MWYCFITYNVSWARDIQTHKGNTEKGPTDTYSGEQKNRQSQLFQIADWFITNGVSYGDSYPNTTCLLCLCLSRIHHIQGHNTTSQVPSNVCHLRMYTWQSILMSNKFGVFHKILQYNCKNLNDTLEQILMSYSHTEH